jgi:3',5'-cyclic AMP phosphodiesterase CpdA
MRVLHFSDIHLQLSFRRVPLTDWFGKRAFGLANLLCGRSRHFADVSGKLAALDRFRREHAVDLIIFTGDYTALGTRSELEAARAAVAPLMQAGLGYVHVPGNHDIYTSDAVRERRFSDVFAETLGTDLPEYRVGDGPWPVVRLISDDVAVVAVNSSHPNPMPWRSSGRIPSPQLRALRHALDDDRLAGRFVFAITHHSPRVAAGTPDRWYHGLTNTDEFLAACAAMQRGAILSGHVHRRSMVHVAGLRVPLFCAGSATQRGRESFWVFDIDGGNMHAVPGHWASDRYVLGHDAATEVEPHMDAEEH